MQPGSSNTPLHNLGRALGDARRAKGTSRLVAAKETGLAFEELAAIEEGRARPQLVNLVKLLIFYDLPPKMILQRLGKADREVVQLLARIAPIYYLYEVERDKAS